VKNNSKSPVRNKAKFKKFKVDNCIKNFIKNNGGREESLTIDRRLKKNDSKRSGKYTHRVQDLKIKTELMTSSKTPRKLMYQKTKKNISSKKGNSQLGREKTLDGRKMPKKRKKDKSILK